MNRIVRRLGSTPQERGSATGQSCPDVFELEDGDFLVIGKMMDGGGMGAASIARRFGASVDSLERAVIVPRRVLIDAKKDIPDE